MVLDLSRRVPAQTLRWWGRQVKAGTMCVTYGSCAGVAALIIPGTAALDGIYIQCFMRAQPQLSTGKVTNRYLHSCISLRCCCAPERRRAGDPRPPSTLAHAAARDLHLPPSLYAHEGRGRCCCWAVRAVRLVPPPSRHPGAVMHTDARQGQNRGLSTGRGT
jgi:hypothetical protein